MTRSTDLAVFARDHRTRKPVESREREHFGWFANMAGGDMSVSSEQTRARLGWKPIGLDLLADLDQAGHYAR
jgi:hypothetical protein